MGGTLEDNPGGARELEAVARGASAAQAGSGGDAADPFARPRLAISKHGGRRLVDGVTGALGRCGALRFEDDSRPVELARPARLGLEAAEDVAAQYACIDAAADVLRRHLEPPVVVRRGLRSC